MVGSSDGYFTKGKTYKVVKVNVTYVTVIDDEHETHHLSYGFIPKHFELISKKEDDIMANSKLKKGDFVRYLGDDPHYDDYLTVGKVYEIALVYKGGEVCIYDDEGNLWDIYELNEDCFVKVYDELTVEPVVSDYEKKTHTFEEKPNEGEVTDAVNSPLHYKRGKFETIEIIEHMTQGYSDPFVSYCVGNTVKYVDRAPYKHATPVEDLRKAAWYLTRAADYIEGKSGAKDE